MNCSVSICLEILSPLNDHCKQFQIESHYDDSAEINHRRKGPVVVTVRHWESAIHKIIRKRCQNGWNWRQRKAQRNCSFQENFPFVKPALSYKENVSIKSVAHFTWGFGGYVCICIRQSMYVPASTKIPRRDRQTHPPPPQSLRPSIKEPRIVYYRISMNGGKRKNKNNKIK